VTIDPSRKFAYVPNAYSNGNTVSQYTIDSVIGVLTPNSPATVTAGNQPTAAGVDPSGRFAYVVNRYDGTVSMFTIDPGTGTLAPKGTIAAGGLPFRIVFDPSGKFVYVVNEASAAAVYTINGDGTLAAMGVTGNANGALSMAIAETAFLPVNGPTSGLQAHDVQYFRQQVHD
jgi:YVTN family beta-propeller protein